MLRGVLGPCDWTFNTTCLRHGNLGRSPWSQIVHEKAYLPLIISIGPVKPH